MSVEPARSAHEDQPYAALVHLSGNRRGMSRLLTRDAVAIGTDAQSDVEVAQPDGAVEGTLARLERRGSTYRLEVGSDAEVWVNGEPVKDLVLASGDVIEMGRGGTVLRFRLYPPHRGPYKSMAEAFSDCIDCARHGGRNALDRAGIVIGGVPYELATRTRPAARAALLLLVAAMITTTVGLMFRHLRLEEQLADEAARIEGLAELLERTERGSFSRADLDAARAELEGRLEALEARADAPERVIAQAESSVVFLQGAYGFVEPDSGRPLRFVVGPGGRPFRLPGGHDAVTLDGDGPVVEIFYTGTGFVASGEGHLLTNRHIALPWLYDPAAQRILEQGFQPVMRRFIGYLPGVPEPFDVQVVDTSDTADVALLSCEAPSSAVRPLPLASTPPAPGDEVIVMGYPAGIRALMARAGDSFAQELAAIGSLDFWQVAERLAAAGHMEPLSTLGIVGQTNTGAIVYDADTTSGGSGGPVITLDGEVVAVNAAIVPGFSGSNIGVPAAEAAMLLEAAQERQDLPQSRPKQ